MFDHCRGAGERPPEEKPGFYAWDLCRATERWEAGAHAVLLPIGVFLPRMSVGFFFMAACDAGEYVMAFVGWRPSNEHRMIPGWVVSGFGCLAGCCALRYN